MIIHEDISQDFNLVDLPGFFQKAKEGRTVGIPGKESLPGVSPTDNMLTSILIVNSQ